MARSLLVAAFAAFAMMLQACGRHPPENRAADAAQKLLAAAWAGDAHGFEAAVDRAAVRADLRRQLATLAQANALSVEGGASDAALDRMITPQAFRLEDERGGALAVAPSKDQVQLLVTRLADGRACVHANIAHAGCLLTFGEVEKDWRLVGMAPAGFTITVPPEPPKPE
jgi:hypothetical protein